MTAAPTGGAASGCRACPTTATTASTCSASTRRRTTRTSSTRCRENSKNGDFKPYVYKSINRGASWESIAGDLPANGPALAFAEDHVNPNLLFVGTEFGLFFTVDGGKKWVRLRGNLPTIAVRDMVIQERENDLVLGTFGRGFYVLDDYTPLRQLSQATFDRDGHDLPHQGGGDRSARDRQGARLAGRATCGWPRTARSARSSPTGSRRRRRSQRQRRQDAGVARRDQRSVAALSDAGRADGRSGRRSAADIPDRHRLRRQASCAA